MSRPWRKTAEMGNRSLVTSGTVSLYQMFDLLYQMFGLKRTQYYQIQDYMECAHMGVGSGGQGEDRAPPDFHDTAFVFFIEHLFCESIPTLTNHRISLLSWLTLRDGG